MRGWGETAEEGWRKGPWTPEEDKLLTQYVNLHGEGRWSSVSRSAGLSRRGKSCRLRWVNYLRPGLKRGRITPQEEGIIIELHALWGNKWSTIARYLPGRTDNEIKNYWRTHFKKKEQKSSQKHAKRKALLLKQKQQQHEQDNDNTKVMNIQSRADTESNDQKIISSAGCGQHQNLNEKQTHAIFMQPTAAENQSWPLAAMYNQDVALWPSDHDHYDHHHHQQQPVDLDDELAAWGGGLWAFDDLKNGRVNVVDTSNSNCNTMAAAASMQQMNQATTTSFAFGGDYSTSVYNSFNNGGYIF